MSVDRDARFAHAYTRLLRAHAATARLLSAALQRAHGLTANDYEALSVLAVAEGRRLKRVELARRLLLTPSGVTRLLEGLEEQGLVERRACPGDLRVTYARLTDAGAQALAAAACDHRRAIAALFEERLDDEEIGQLAALLERLAGVAEDGGDRAAARSFG